MRVLSDATRRRFGLLMGAGLVAPLVVRKAAAHDGPHMIEAGIEGFAFVPDRLEIRAGDTVRWTNHDIAPHTATDKAGGWDTGRIAKGESAEVTFEAPGAYTVFCRYHPNMVAEIVVEAT
ncbi:cupredoxin family copper-binding protein [Defluviimonas aestuarii]|uniref:cupredoxin domain-containing protein n=1 Tax=Albidovulum aestuarii TaxID=1130726 RepID=UPI002499DBAB|nr:cupredoxin family copper-binding protein [Defluviimonas aestuarii]MDI3338754.1 cupredoxin family copper-binding protein [Defluviimonas aestuarii]